jgi:hypothetical protein
MRHLKLLGVSLVAMLSILAVTTSTASARCAHVIEPNTGTFDRALCIGGAGIKLYIKVKLGGLIVAGDIECAEVETGESGAKFSNSKCTSETGTKKFVLVLQELGGWKGVPEGGATPLASTAKVDSFSKLALKVGTTNVKVECKGTLLSGTGLELMAVDEILATSITFEKCETTEPAKCELEGQPTSIRTEPIRGFAKAATAPADRITVIPATKNRLLTLPFKEGNTCGLATEEPLNGSVTLAMPTGQSEEVAQAIEGMGSIENNSLEAAGNKAFIEGGRTLLKLASGSKWDFD